MQKLKTLCALLIILCPLSSFGCNKCGTSLHYHGATPGKLTYRTKPASWRPTKEQKKKLTSLWNNINELIKNGNWKTLKKTNKTLSLKARLCWKMGIGKKFEHKIKKDYETCLKKVQNPQEKKGCENSRQALLQYAQKQFAEIINS